MKKHLLLSLIFLCITALVAQEKENPKDVLLIGTFHYNNPGADVAKTKSFDILSESAQNDLEKMTAGIKAYKPYQGFCGMAFMTSNESWTPFINSIVEAPILTTIAFHVSIGRMKSFNCLSGGQGK